MVGEDLHIHNRTLWAAKVARQTGKFLTDSFGKISEVTSKEDKSLATDVDLEAERRIVELIRKKYPEDNFLSEESKYPEGTSDFKWVIDPMDGTHNFVHKIRIFGVSIGLALKEEIVSGIIYMPIQKELYVAEIGKGTYLNGRRIEVSKRSLKETTMIYDSSLRDNRKLMLEVLDELAPRVFNIRMLGSTARGLSYVAEGKAEVEVEFNDKVWDFAAGLILVEEAGGRSTDFDGNRWNLDSKEYIASNGVIHDEIVEIINKVRKK